MSDQSIALALPDPQTGRARLLAGEAAESLQLRQTAAALEASFLSVMLQSAGFGAARDSFGGGIGEEQFSSFLVDVHAEALVKRGGIGLSEALVRAMSGEADP